MNDRPLLSALLIAAGLALAGALTALYLRRAPAPNTQPAPAADAGAASASDAGAAAAAPDAGTAAPEPEAAAATDENGERARLSRRESELAALPAPTQAQRDELLRIRVTLRYARSVLPGRLSLAHAEAPTLALEDPAPLTAAEMKLVESAMAKHHVDLRGEAPEFPYVLRASLKSGEVAAVSICWGAGEGLYNGIVWIAAGRARLVAPMEPMPVSACPELAGLADLDGDGEPELVVLVKDGGRVFSPLRTENALRWSGDPTPDPDADDEAAAEDAPASPPPDPGASAADDALAGTRSTEPLSGLAFVDIPGGQYRPHKGAGPVHVPAFAIGETETTVEAYARCVKAGACNAAGAGGACNSGSDRAGHPINCVRYGQAVLFCKWIGGRLPATEEYEYLASGLGEGRTYPWGDEEPGARSCWNGEGNEAGAGARKTTCAVGTHPAGDSRFGVHDLAGNVIEWMGSDLGDTRKANGGSWNNSMSSFQRALREGSGGMHPAYRSDEIGFRCRLPVARSK